MNKIKNSFNSSNRNKHFWYSVILGFLFTIICPVSMGIGMELKDKWKGGIFDWEDLIWGSLGGLLGQSIQIMVIILIVFL